MSHNPFDGVSKLGESSGHVRFLSEDERVGLLAATVKDPQLHTFTLVALSTAARAGELWNLSWRDVDLKEGRLLLRETKNSQPRTAWVHGEALRLLAEHGKVRRLGDDRVFVSKTGKRYRYEKTSVPPASPRTSEISRSMICVTRPPLISRARARLSSNSRRSAVGSQTS